MLSGLLHHIGISYRMLFLLACLQTGTLFTSAVKAQPVPESIKTPKELLDGFMNKRFGMFIHYGPVTLRGTEIGWSRNREVNQAEYDTLYKEFNPVLFSATAWVNAARAAGMKYLVITAKHHDGFCLWPTRVSAYNIAHSPFKNDIVGELAKACKKQGIAFCVYFSVLDWHDVNYPVHNPYDTTQNVTGNMRRFVATMKAELKEIITRYHPYLLWFDGNWEKPWTTRYAAELYRYIKNLDKNVIINNRLGKGLHTAFSHESVGDYLTPEQRIGALNMHDSWESCITIGRQWAWKPNDSLKTVKECVQTLVKTAAGNGNLLLNVSPMMDGRMEQRQVALLKEVGAWLNTYGESIYCTKGGPYIPNNDYATTRRGNKIYIHLFDAASSPLHLPVIPGIKIYKAHFLKGNPVNIQQDTSQVQLNLPSTLPSLISNVIVLETNCNTEEIPVIQK